MGSVTPPLRVKAICAATFQGGTDIEKIRTLLEQAFGRIEDRSPVFEFSTFTRYYEDEMGSGLKKVFFSFADSMKPEALSEMKIRTQSIEAAESDRGRRRINLDPGYLTAAKLILASTKDFSHRIHLSRGIYGDMQLRFVHGVFRPSEWTYPDYQTDLAFTFFQNVRNRFIRQEKEHERNHPV